MPGIDYLSQRLRGLLAQHAVPVEALSRAMEGAASVSSLYAWLRGGRAVGHDKVASIVCALRGLGVPVTADYLLGLDDSPTPQNRTAKLDYARALNRAVVALANRGGRGVRYLGDWTPDPEHDDEQAGPVTDLPAAKLYMVRFITDNHPDYGSDRDITDLLARARPLAHVLLGESRLSLGALRWLCFNVEPGASEPADDPPWWTRQLGRLEEALGRAVSR